MRADDVATEDGPSAIGVMTVHGSRKIEDHDAKAIDLMESAAEYDEIDPECLRYLDDGQDDYSDGDPQGFDEDEISEEFMP